MVETLEELKELNKRKVVINYDQMLGGYDNQRQTEVELQEAEEDAMISMYFGEKGEDGVRIKRLADDDSDEERRQKKAKTVIGATAKATDLLAAPQTGTNNVVKKKLNNLVRPKKANESSTPSSSSQSSVTATPPATSSASVPVVSLKPTTATQTPQPEIKKTIGGLSLLGSYSDSESGSDSWSTKCS